MRMGKGRFYTHATSMDLCIHCGMLCSFGFIVFKGFVILSCFCLASTRGLGVDNEDGGMDGLRGCVIS